MGDLWRFRFALSDNGNEQKRVAVERGVWWNNRYRTGRALFGDTYADAFAIGLSESIAICFPVDYAGPLAFGNAATISYSAAVGLATTGDARI